MCINSKVVKKYKKLAYKNAVIGVRTWNWKWSVGKLSPMVSYVPNSWYGVRNATDRSPFQDSDYGYHAYKSWNSLWGRGRLTGKIKMYGRVVEHVTGYRAEKVEIVSIHVPKQYADTIPVLKTTYPGVKIVRKRA